MKALITNSDWFVSSLETITPAALLSRITIYSKHLMPSSSGQIIVYPDFVHGIY